MRAWLQRFMYGRYGYDQLSWFFLILYLVLYLLTLLTGLDLFYMLGSLGLFYSLFRIFSRNLPKRRGENAKFLQAVGPFLRWWKLQSAMRKDKDHRYFKCPNCSQQLRVPRGKGKVSVTCRNCGVSFEENT